MYFIEQIILLKVLYVCKALEISQQNNRIKKPLSKKNSFLTFKNLN